MTNGPCDTRSMDPLSSVFGSAADDYDKSRPGYPVEAVRWVLDGAATVADVGAGTGKLTQELRAVGAEVVAVDHDPAMLGRLEASLPGVPVLVGSAEHLPLEDASVDAVVFGQAWHWVDRERASREAARVLRPGGTLGLVWNIRDDRVPWVAAMTAAMGGSKAERLLAGEEGPQVAAPFGALEQQRWEWAEPATYESLAELARTRSVYIGGDHETRRRIDEAVADVLDTVPGLAASGAVELPYVTYAYRVKVHPVD